MPEKPAGWDEPDKLNAEWANREPVPAHPPSSGVSDAPTAPQCSCRPEMRAAKDSMTRIDFVIVRCPLHEAAPALYTALDDLTDITVCIDGPIGTDPQFFGDLRQRTRRAFAVMAKARGESA